MRELDPDVEERNYAHTPLGRADLGRILEAAGSVGAVLNARHRIARENGWKEHPPAPAVFLEAAFSEPNLLRRPITLRGKRIVVGPDGEALRALFRGE